MIIKIHRDGCDAVIGGECRCGLLPPGCDEEQWDGAWCAQCGPDTAVDEDGACTSCGADSLGDGAQQAHAWRKLAQDMGEFLSGACPDAQAWVGDGGLAERLDALEFQGQGGKP